METTPLLDYRTSVAARALFELSATTLSRLIVSFPRASPSALTAVRLRPRPNLFIYALLRRHPPALKDSVNWLEIDFADIARLCGRPCADTLPRFGKEEAARTSLQSNRAGMNLIVRRGKDGKRRPAKSALYFCKGN